MSPETPPPRLFVIAASEADEAVIFRKGPADWCHIIRWNTVDDSFHRGAWIKARVYAERCDLSPNGRLLLYFAFQGGRHGTTYKRSYSAISRSPWLKALVLWPEGDTWGGGGRFTSNSHVVLRSGGLEKHPDHADPLITCSRGDSEWHRSSEEVPESEWSGRDRHGRVIFAKEGKIFRRSGTGQDVELIDLCDLKPEPMPAPESVGDVLQRYGKNGDI
jgi:hypothetical protein